MKNDEQEDVLLTSWEDWFSKVNKKLILYKKDSLSAVEIPQIKIVSFVMQELVTLAPEHLFYIFDRSRTVPEELMEKIRHLDKKLDSLNLEKNNLENQLNQITEENKNFAHKFEAQDIERHKLKEEISSLNLNYVKKQESGELKVQTMDNTEKEKDKKDSSDKEKKDSDKKDPFKVKIKFGKPGDDKEKKKLKENLIQQQAIQDHLIEELKTTTGILNDTLEQKTNLQSQNTTLQNTLTILEKKITTYQGSPNFNEADIPCNMVPSVIELVVKFILERRKTEHYFKLLHPQQFSAPDPGSPKIPKTPKSPKDNHNHNHNHISQSPLESPSRHHLNDPHTDSSSTHKAQSNPFDQNDGNPF